MLVTPSERSERWLVSVLLLVICFPAVAFEPNQPTSWDIAYLTFALTTIGFYSIAMVLLRAYVWLSYSVMAVLLIVLMASVDGTLAFVLGKGERFVEMAPMYFGCVTAAAGFIQSAWLIDSQSNYRKFIKPFYVMALISLLLVLSHLFTDQLMAHYAALNVLLLMMLASTFVPPMSWPVALPERSLAAWPPIVMLLIILGVYTADFLGAEFSVQFRDGFNRVAVLAYLVYGMGFGLYYLYSQARARRIAQRAVDVAALKAAQDELKLQQAERSYMRAVKVSEARQRQLQEASHDIRQPIAALRRAANDLKSSLTRDSSETLIQIVDYLDQLATTYLKSNENSIEYDDEESADENSTEAVPTSLLIDTVIQLHQREAHERGVKLVVDDVGAFVTVPPLVVVRLLSNLLSNALKHAKATTINISTHEEEHHVAIRVTDNGRGINEVLRQTVTQPGVRGCTSDGSGLGLSIVASYAEQHGWPFDLDSAADAGTSAVLRLPCLNQ